MRGGRGGAMEKVRGLGVLFWVLAGIFKLFFLFLVALGLFQHLHFHFDNSLPASSHRKTEKSPVTKD